MNCFRDNAQILLGGMKATEYAAMINDSAENNDVRSIGEEFKNKRYKLLVKCSEDTYQEELRKRYTAIKIFPVSWKRDNDDCLKILQQYEAKK